MAEGGVIPGGRQSARGGLPVRGGEFDMCPRGTQKFVAEVSAFRSRLAHLATRARPPTGLAQARVASGKTFVYYT